MQILPLKPSFATLCIPGSKSYTNRALILAALTKGAVHLKNYLYCEDTLAMVHSLQTLGIEIKIESNTLSVYGDISSIEEKSYRIFVKESGTTLRFIVALLCLVPGTKVVEGGARLSERPICDLIKALQDLGARIEYCKQKGQLPIKVLSSRLTRTSVCLAGDVSSQFCSALLLISPLLPDLTIYRVGHSISQPYIDMTLSCMKMWGVTVDQKSNSYFIAKKQRYQKESFVIEGDFSSACYFFAIAALTKSSLTIENLNPQSLQADREFLAILERMGNRVSYQKDAIFIEGRGVKALEVNMERSPDQIMTLAVLAAFAKGRTVIHGICSLKVKESDRILAVEYNLKKMGIRTETTLNTLFIYGGSPCSATIETYRDHRVAMAFAVAGAYIPGIVICNPEVVDKTYPHFWKDFESLR